jgi:hypothetical protein
MDAQATDALPRFFRGMRDPRADNARHGLDDIMAIAIMAVPCGRRVGRCSRGCGNRPWLATFLELPHGIPSHDTFDRVLALLDPLAFEKCFANRTATPAARNSDDPFLAVDGKTLRRSFKRAWSKTPVHLVSAFATKNQLGQLATDAKSNEVAAIPKLLALLELSGVTVTIDAMGC